MVLTSSMARVIGPDAAGTGVIQPATRARQKIDVAAQLAFVVAVHADVDDHRAGLDHVGGQGTLRFARPRPPRCRPGAW